MITLEPDIIILELYADGLEKIRTRDINLVIKRLYKVLPDDIYFDVSENTIIAAVQERPDLFSFDRDVDEGVLVNSKVTHEYIKEYILWRIPHLYRKRFKKAIKKYVKRVLEDDI